MDEDENEEGKELENVEEQPEEKEPEPQGEKWTGYFIPSSKQTEVVFDTLIIDKGKIRGKGTEKFGDFQLEGTVDEQGKVLMDKKFRGKALVNLVGQLQEKAGVRRMQGDW